MTQVQQIPQQMKQEIDNFVQPEQTMSQSIKQTQSMDKDGHKVITISQKLSVQVMEKTQHLNPQKQQSTTQNVPQNTSKYGPFHELSPNAKALLSTQNLNYDINIEPILTNISQQNNPNQPKNNKPTKQKKSQSILTQQSVTQNSSKPNPEQLQRQILQLAKNIRKKVWKKQSPRINNEESTSSNMHKKVQPKETELKLRQIYQKRQSLFEKYSSPHSVGVSLAQLQKQQQRLKLGKYNLSRVYHQQQQLQQPQSQSQTPKPSTNTIHPQSITPQQQRSPNRSHPRTHDSQSTRKQSQLPRLKLSFDKTHHKYKMTEFRKSILQQNKDKQIAKSLLIKEKEQTLQKRRDLYNNSRYHPVGIKLSSLRMSKLVNKSILQKEGEYSIEASPRGNRENRQVNDFRINSIQQGEIVKQQQIQQKNENSQLKLQKIGPQTISHSVNQSQVKSSLTFNFSFGDPIQAELKSQAQVYSELQNLTKMLQNDSTPKQKMQKLQQQNQKNKQNNSEKEVKKWTSSNIDKGMSESKTIGELENLHNSSYQENAEQDKDVQLEYSYVR